MLCDGNFVFFFPFWIFIFFRFIDWIEFYIIIYWGLLFYHIHQWVRKTEILEGERDTLNISLYLISESGIDVLECFHFIFFFCSYNINFFYVSSNFHYSLLVRNFNVGGLYSKSNQWIKSIGIKFRNSETNWKYSNERGWWFICWRIIFLDETHLVDTLKRRRREERESHCFWVRCS